MKGLEHCLSRYVGGLCDGCSYMGELDKSYKIPIKCKEIIMRDALALLKEQEIVLCKDCMYYNSEPDCHGDYCNKIHWSRGLDWFCADGVRR